MCWGVRKIQKDLKNTDCSFAYNCKVEDWLIECLYALTETVCKYVSSDCKTGEVSMNKTKEVPHKSECSALRLHCTQFKSWDILKTIQRWFYLFLFGLRAPKVKYFHIPRSTTCE